MKCHFNNFKRSLPTQEVFNHLNIGDIFDAQSQCVPKTSPHPHMLVHCTQFFSLHRLGILQERVYSWLSSHWHWPEAFGPQESWIPHNRRLAFTWINSMMSLEGRLAFVNQDPFNVVTAFMFPSIQSLKFYSWEFLRVEVALYKLKSCRPRRSELVNGNIGYWVFGIFSLIRMLPISHKWLRRKIYSCPNTQDPPFISVDRL